MKNFVISILLCLVSNANLIAQVSAKQGVIKGYVVDSMAKIPIPFATVSLYENRKLVTGNITDSTGKFELKNLQYGNYSLTISSVGFDDHISSGLQLDPNRPFIDLGRIGLRANAKELNTLVVRGQKPLIEQRVDGINFNVESLQAIANADASDILRKVPMISVDANGGISMRGSSNIKVFIDGKASDLYAPSVADALKSIRGENILRVEVITNPSARYDAEGTDGVVNIITKKNATDATNGNIGGIIGNRSDNIMGDIHSKSGKWLFNADGFYQIYWNRNGSELTRETDQLKQFQKNESNQSGNYSFSGANMLYSLDSLNTLSVGLRVRTSSNATDNVSENFDVENQALIPIFSRTTISPYKNNGASVNAGYNGTSKNGKRELSLLGMFFGYGVTNGYDLIQSGKEVIDFQENFNGSARNRDFTFQVDYTQTFSKNCKWEAGGKINQKNLRSVNDFEILDPVSNQYAIDKARSNTFQYMSGIYAVYNSLNLKLNKWGIVGGIRYELTVLNSEYLNSDLDIPSFGNFVPQILINRVLDDKSTLKLSYAMKLVRPFFTYLNPTINNSDSLNIQYGNPYLRPEIINRYQLSYTTNNPKLFKDFAAFFNDNRNSIENIRTPVSDGVFESTWKNVGQNQRLGLSATLTWKPNKDLSLGGTVTTQYVWMKSAALDITNSGLMKQLVLNWSYKFPKGYGVDLYGFFDSRNIRLQGYREGWKYYSLTVSKKSNNDRMKVSLRMDMILTPYTFINEEFTTEVYHQTQRFRYQNQNIRLTFSFKLGKKEIKAPKMRQVESGDQ